MARRARKVTRRRRKSFSITNAIFSVGYADVISRGLFGTNILSFFLGRTSAGFGGGFVSGPALGIKELIDDPTALNTVLANAQKQLPNMLIQSFMLGITERVFKQVMRRPLANVNRNIVKPLLGAGVRL